MANTPTCDIDETALIHRSNPPNVQTVEIRLAAESYDVTLCRECIATRSLSEVIAAAQGKPGGTAEGADTLRYLIRR